MTYPTQANRSALQSSRTQIELPNLRSKTAGWFQRPLRQRITIVSGVAAFALVLIIFLSQVIISSNPYDEAQEQVNYLLQSQPDLGSRLDYNAAAQTTLQPLLREDLAFIISDYTLSEVQEEWITLLADSGIPASDIRSFSGLMGGLAQEIQGLDASLQASGNQENLKSLFTLLSNDPQAASSTILKSIHTESPLLVSRINDLRSRMQSIANSVRLINETPALIQVAQALENTSANQRTALVYLQALESWSKLPSACVSLEIQFAGTVSTLENITQAIDQARRQDRQFAYSLWEPIALWLSQQRWLIVVGSVALFLLSMMPALLRTQTSKSVTLTTRTRSPITQPVPARTVSTVNRRTKPSQRLFESDTPWLVNGLTPAQPAPAPSRKQAAARQTRHVQPRLMAMWPDGRRELRVLESEKSFRVGSDSRYAIPIQGKGGGYIDIWIRGAQVGHFVEVMFSDVPVLINRKPFDGARMLRHGDMIQILDLVLVYLEY
jgi:hypothetical protein